MTRTVLIIEDEFLIALDHQAILEAHGWRVLGPVPTVEAALSLLARERPDVALLDINLRGIPSTPVAEALVAAGVPFATASAYDKPERIGGDVMIGVPNVGKPAKDGRILAVLVELLKDTRAD